MSGILLFPLALILGGPFMFGVLTGSTKLYFMLRKQFNAQTSLTIIFCVLAVAACLMTAPYWVLGTNGYFATVGVYVFFVALGVPKFSKLLRFLNREFDGDDDNDVDVDATPKKPGK